MRRHDPALAVLGIVTRKLGGLRYFAAVGIALRHDHQVAKRAATEDAADAVTAPAGPRPGRALARHTPSSALIGSSAK